MTALKLMPRQHYPPPPLPLFIRNHPPSAGLAIAGPSTRTLFLYPRLGFRFQAPHRTSVSDDDDPFSRSLIDACISVEATIQRTPNPSGSAGQKRAWRAQVQQSTAPPPIHWSFGRSTPTCGRRIRCRFRPRGGGNADGSRVSYKCRDAMHRKAERLSKSGKTSIPCGKTHNMACRPVGSRRPLEIRSGKRQARFLPTAAAQH
ncbi:hypothetical protein BJV74DRAFT_453241 [Russula compacta]|nr:hypothetical protein BJV74DRAFT_453241 [Russula compacta]